jgi:hypothetical protein
LDGRVVVTGSEEGCIDEIVMRKRKRKSVSIDDVLCGLRRSEIKML